MGPQDPGHFCPTPFHFRPLFIGRSAGWSEHVFLTRDLRPAAGGNCKTCAVPSAFETFQLFCPLSICFPCCAANGPTLNRATTPHHYHNYHHLSDGMFDGENWPWLTLRRAQTGCSSPAVEPRRALLPTRLSATSLRHAETCRSAFLVVAGLQACGFAGLQTDKGPWRALEKRIDTEGANYGIPRYITLQT